MVRGYAERIGPDCGEARRGRGGAGLCTIPADDKGPPQRRSPIERRSPMNCPVDGAELQMTERQVIAIA